MGVAAPGVHDGEPHRPGWERADGPLLPPTGAPEPLLVTVDGDLTSDPSDSDRIEIYDFTYNAVQPKISEFYAGIPLDSRLYAALKEYAASSHAKISSVHLVTHLPTGHA